MKTIDDFIVLFAGELQRTKPSELHPETNFRELDDWTSLTMLSIIEMIEEEFGVSVRDFDLRTINSIGSLYALVQKRTEK